MKESVALFKDGTKVTGEYDGYGSINDRRLFDENYECNVAVYHKACWEKAGKPEYDGPSKDANDQGWFFEDKDYPAEPPYGEYDPDWDG